MKKILVPLDGSEISEKVLNHIETLATHFDAEITLLRVVPFLWPNELPHLSELADKLLNDASEYLFSVMKRLEKKGIKGEYIVHKGTVPEVICDFAKERKVELIAMSTHGWGGIKRWALGSVADKVIQIAPVPVLLCRIIGDRVADARYKNVLIPVDGSSFAENIFPQARTLIEMFGAKVWFLYVIDTHLIESFTALSERTRNEEEKITKNVKDVLLDLQKQRTENHWSMFIDWCFPSPRTKDKKFLMKGNENNTDKARLKDIVGCFRAVVQEAGILRPVAMKMFRNTHENKVNESKRIRSTWDVISVTGRTDTKSAEKNYLNKKLTGNVAAIVNDVDDEFSKIISFAGKK